jgi:hypothetical protein
VDVPEKDDDFVEAIHAVVPGSGAVAIVVGARVVSSEEFGARGGYV